MFVGSCLQRCAKDKEREGDEEMAERLLKSLPRRGVLVFALTYLYLTWSQDKERREREREREREARKC